LSARPCTSWIAAAALALSATAAAQERPTREIGGETGADAVEVAGRVLGETLVGAGVATAGFLAGPGLGAAGCRRCVLAAGFATALATFPLGVYWGGDILGGAGSFWLTVAGPWMVSGATWIALALDQETEGSPAVQIATIGGAIAAPLGVLLYELSDPGRWRPARGDSPARVGLAPLPGGAAVLVAGTF
jgi:hypothetical protein